MHHSTKQLKVGNFEAGVEKKKNKGREKIEGIIGAHLWLHGEKQASGMRPHHCCCENICV